MLSGELVTLRAAAESDLDRLYELWSELATWEERGPRPPMALSRADFEQRIRAQWTASSDDAHFVITVGDVVVGRTDLFGVDNLARSAEVGISLHPDSRGKGYGTDALRLIVEFGFVRRNLHRIHLTTIASNARALASYRKAGFVEEGRLREAAWVRGRYEDEVRMGLLRSEWAQQQG
jgi:RimJ/RimL family protein N-acetyltransferase